MCNIRRTQNARLLRTAACVGLVALIIYVTVKLLPGGKKLAPNDVAAAADKRPGHPLLHAPGYRFRADVRRASAQPAAAGVGGSAAEAAGGPGVVRSVVARAAVVPPDPGQKGSGSAESGDARGGDGVVSRTHAGDPGSPVVHRRTAPVGDPPGSPAIQRRSVADRAVGDPGSPDQSSRFHQRRRRPDDAERQPLGHPDPDKFAIQRRERLIGGRMRPSQGPGGERLEFRPGQAIARHPGYLGGRQSDPRSGDQEQPPYRRTGSPRMFVPYSTPSEYFRTRLQPKERQSLMRTFKAMVTAFDAANVTYWMDSSTLLGSYRHHGIIPWDDDVDVLVSAADRQTALRALTALRPDYELYVETVGGDGANATTEAGWRFYPTSDSVPVNGTRYRFPLVDVLFYEQNATHVWCRMSGWWPYMVWPRDGVVFPLRRRPFGDVSAPAPCDSAAYLRAELGQNAVDVCQSPRQDHRDVKAPGQRLFRVPCRQLRSKIALVVNRTRDDAAGSVVETLSIRDQRTKTVTIAGGKCRPDEP